MRTSRGFTLIEVMIVVAIIALLAAVGFPSYRTHVAKGQRSQGQQFLSDIAQRQEHYLLDRRQYATAWDTSAGGLGFAALPDGFKYDAPSFAGVNNGTTPPSYTICMSPAAGSTLASRNDGRLCINNQGQQWREAVGGDGVFGAGDCAWSSSTCRLSDETS